MTNPMTETDAHYQRIVVKIGSSSLTDESGHLDRHSIANLASQIQQIKQQGTEVIIVSSGAITAGLESLGFVGPRPDDLPSLQAAAAVGQLALAQAYADVFATHDLKLGQVLLTWMDLENRSSYLHARDTLERLLELGAVPLINENDTVAVEEIRFGDNDTLAAQLGILVKADLVILLSDIEGLYTADPRIHEDAELLESIASFTADIVAAAGDAGTTRGSGGMVTKLEAARMCMAAGIPMVICHGRRPDAISAIVSGRHIGTIFDCDHENRASARRLWLALAGKVKGSLIVDTGAEKALRDSGSSLLAVGIREVWGDFKSDSAVDIRSLDDTLIGRGLSAYSSEEALKAAGLKSIELKDYPDLKHLASTPVVHRDQLVIF